MCGCRSEKASPGLQLSTEQNNSALKPLLVLAAVAVLLALAVSGWAYFSGKRTLRVQARELNSALASGPGNELTGNAVEKADLIKPFVRYVEGWAQKITLANAAAGIGLTAIMLVGVSLWQRHMQESAGELPQVRKLRYEMQTHLKERRRAEAEMNGLKDEMNRLKQDVDRQVQERATAIEKTYSKLQVELNERKQSERTLAHQRQELERSKDVLELHVQARTQELQKLQHRYEHILNSAGEGIYGLDMQGKTTFVNPAAAKLTGFKVEELVGKLEHEVFHRVPPSGSGRSPQTAFIAKDGGNATEQLFYRKDGSTFPVEYVRTPILENTRQMGAVVVFKDITERKRAEETLARKAAELARSNGELEQFAYVASHDLQEPLRKIRAFGDRLKGKMNEGDVGEGREYLERMQNAAARMQTLINDLLTFSRVISTTQPFVPVDLAALTREVLSDLEVRIEQTKAKIEVGDLPTIDADPMQMRQLLQNVIGNALKFQPPKAAPEVKVTAEIVRAPFSNAAEPTADDQVCLISVQDNGIGFEEKYMDKIFAMFGRLHGRSEYEGTGVGLAVCRRITDRHSGTIIAKSKPGEGATFVIRLPVRQGKQQDLQQAA
jgi:PAS domain S-box-containing protein